jgi:hypothetical protein
MFEPVGTVRTKKEFVATKCWPNGSLEFEYKASLVDRRISVIEEAVSKDAPWLSIKVVGKKY